MIFSKITEFFDVQSYNYWVELCSLIFLIVLFARFIASKKFKSTVNFIFGSALICGLIDLTLDIVACLLLDNYTSVPVEVIRVVNGLFYVFQVMFPALMFVFVISIAGYTFRDKKWLSVFLIPIVLFLILIFTNIFTDCIFYIDHGATNGIFKHGPLFILYYTIVAFYLILTPISMIFLKKKIDKQQIITMTVSMGIIIAAIIVQILNSDLLLTGLAISLSCWLTYEKMANASEMVDKVTGVFNYNALITFLSNEISLGRRNCYYIIINIESIAPINTAFGIKVGNETYKEIGNYFKSLCKGSVWLFRVFNSRFVFACREEKKQNYIKSQIRERFNSPWQVYDNSFDLKCYTYDFQDSPQIKTCDEFIEFANTLDQQVSKEVNGRYIHISEEYMDALSRNKKIENALKNAINNNFEGFELYYQPIYDANVDTYTYAEVLLRFLDKDLGFISPGEFIPVAESSGLVRKIDEFVLTKTCIFLKEHPYVIGLSINISYIEFFDNPSEKFIKIVKQLGVDPKRICFEVTETATVKYSDKIELFLNKMIKKGFSFALDDFGTGYSNISRIVSKSFGFVKLDKVFLSASDKMATVLKNIVGLFKELNIPVVVEGVETKEQYKKMIDLGIYQIQGYYFSRPLPEHRYEAFLESIKK